MCRRALFTVSMSTVQRLLWLVIILMFLASFVAFYHVRCGDCMCDQISGKWGSNPPPASYGREEVGKRLPSTWLVVLILSTPNEQRRRDTIRETWLQLSRKGEDTVWHRFPIGLKGLSTEEITALRREQSAHGDLLFLEEHEEKFDALTNKMKHAFTIVHNMIKYEYLLKVDSDSFVRLGVLIKSLTDIEHPTLYWGFLRGNARVQIHTSSKYKETDWKLCDRYIPYMVGGGYVLSYLLVDFIVRNSMLLKSYVNEDISIGTWLAGVNVHYVHDPRFDTEWAIIHIRNARLDRDYPHESGENAMNIRYFTAAEQLTTDTMKVDGDGVVENYGSYENRHASFVSGHDGGTRFEIILICFIGPLSVLLRNLVVPWIFPARKFNNGTRCDRSIKHLVDFILLVLPTVLVVTIFSDRLLYVVFTLSAMCAALCLFCAYEYLSLYRDRTTLSEAISTTVDNPRPLFITYIRAYCLLSTTVLILAVDFPVMPRRFAKTETFGYSLMDTGVAAYTLIAGLTAAETKLVPNRLSRRILNAIPLIILGAIRLVMVKTAGYHEHVTEYGVHWNFFFTLAAVKIITSCLSTIIPLRRFSFLVALVLCTGYQILLSHYGLERVVLKGFDGRDSRTDLIDANREGIISLVGYLCIHLCAIQIGVHLQRPRAHISAWLGLFARACVGCTLAFGLHYWLNENVAEASRRMANSTFVVWTIFCIGLMMTCYLGIEVITMFASAMQIPLFSADLQDQLKPCLFDAMNRRSLLMFCLANVATGLVNLSIPTIDVHDPLISTSILAGYTFILMLLIKCFPNSSSTTHKRRQ